MEIEGQVATISPHVTGGAIIPKPIGRPRLVRQEASDDGYYCLSFNRSLADCLRTLSNHSELLDDPIVVSSIQRVLSLVDKTKNDDSKRSSFLDRLDESE